MMSSSMAQRTRLDVSTHRAYLSVFEIFPIAFMASLPFRIGEPAKWTDWPAGAAICRGTNRRGSMTAPPADMTKTPIPDRKQVWTHSDVLRVAHLTGGVFLHAEFFAPWCIATRI